MRHGPSSGVSGRQEFDVVPETIPMDQMYFDVELFVAWIDQHMPGLSERRQAVRFGINRELLRAYKSGRVSPMFESLMRMAARVRADPRRWSRGWAMD